MKITNSFKNRVILFLLLCITSIQVTAQVVPFSTNPIKNPYTNPFGNDQNGSDKRTTKKKTEDKKTDKKEATNAEDNVNAAKEKVKNKKENKEDKNNNDENENQDGETIDKNNKDYKDEEIEIIKEDPTNNVYGMDYFKSSDFNTSDKYSLTPPADYRLGIGDEVIINIFGNSETQQTFTIGRDGAIFPQFAGKISLQGMSYANAKTLIQNRYRKVVASGSDIDVQLGKIRTIKITLIGEILRNGSVSVSAFTTAVAALSNAGGITKLGNLRNIEIRRQGRVINNLDLYEFIKNGGNSEDQYLEDGDVINVGTYDKLVKAEGSFKRPMYYQLKQEENLNNLIDLAGGPAFDARFSSVQIKSIVNETAKILTVNLKDINNKSSDYALLDGDIINIKKINPVFANTVEIEGSVNYPDIYQVENGDRLSNLITKAGGILSDAYTSRAYVYRGDTNLNTGISKIDLNELLNGNYKNDMEILPGDRIMIVSKKDFVSKYKIKISGSVKKPLEIEYYSGMRLKDLLIAAGGLTMDAENGRIEVSSIIDSADNYEMKMKNNTSWKTITINPNLELDKNSEDIILLPYDVVYVRRKSNFKLLETVSINGEVNYPGEYPIINETDKVSDLIKRAGGLKSSADFNSARYSRQEIGEIGLDLNAILNNKSKINADILLKNGDSIVIGKKNEMVAIRGQVLRPFNTFGDPNNESLLSYINQAGGFSERPWKDRISVQSANGKIKTTKRIFFIRKYPKVAQGSIITIPQKPDKKDYQLTWKDVASFTTSFLTSVTSIITTALLISKIK